MLAKEAEFIRKKLDSITLMTTLIAFGGLLGTGKTVIIREVAREVNAVYVRIDTAPYAPTLPWEWLRWATWYELRRRAEPECDGVPRGHRG
jgi:hypothetical protein